MAIVFISPKRKQRAFLWAIGSGAGLVLLAICTLVFLPYLTQKDSYNPANVTYIPEIIIDSKILDSDKVKNLQITNNLPIEFNYVVEDDKKVQTQGSISATSRDEAQSMLEQRGLTVISVQETDIGRDNPFVSY